MAKEYFRPTEVNGVQEKYQPTHQSWVSHSLGFFNMDGTPLDEAGLADYNSKLDNLNNLYYNIGQQLTGGKKKKSAKLLSDATFVPMEDDEIISYGKSFINRDSLTYGKPKSVLDYEKAQKNLSEMLEMQSRGDTGPYGKNTTGFSTALNSLYRQIDRYQPEVDAYNYYTKNINSTDPIHRTKTDVQYSLSDGEFVRRIGETTPIRPLNQEIKTQEAPNVSSGFTNNVSDYEQNVSQFDQNVSAFDQRVIQSPRSKKFSPNSHRHITKLT